MMACACPLRYAMHKYAHAATPDQPVYLKRTHATCESPWTVIAQVVYNARTKLGAKPATELLS